MNAALILNFLQQHVIAALAIGLVLCAFVVLAVRALHRRFGQQLWRFGADAGRALYERRIYFCYVGILLAVLIWATQTEQGTDNRLYFCTFLIGMATAFAEIIGKFNDEPLKALGTWHALCYHLLNGAIAALALYVLIISDMPHTTAAQRFQIVVAAGFGSMLVMRSKLFNVKAGGEDVALGPEQIIKVFFRFMEAAIDRVRAQSRVDFVRATLHNIDFDKVEEYSVTMLAAAQVRDGMDAYCEEIKKLRTQEYADRQLRAYALGFLLLDRMGEGFVTKLFTNPPSEWALQAPIPTNKQATLLDRLLGAPDDAVYYMAYGRSMCSRNFRASRLKWALEETKFDNMTVPKRCLLKRYRLEFDKPSDPDEKNAALVLGLPNIEEDENDEVEGVLYKLTAAALEFVDNNEDGYKRKTVEVLVDGKPIKAEVYQAEITRRALRPNAEAVRVVLDGAREHRLSGAYIERLEGLLAAAAEPPRAATTTVISDADVARAAGSEVTLGAKSPVVATTSGEKLNGNGATTPQST